MPGRVARVVFLARRVPGSGPLSGTRGYLDRDRAGGGEESGSAGDYLPARRLWKDSRAGGREAGERRPTHSRFNACRCVRAGVRSCVSNYSV